MSWMDISTAPKDGTEIDLFCICKETGRRERRINCSWGEIYWGGMLEGFGWRGMFREYREFEPTHWRIASDEPLTPPQQHADELLEALEAYEKWEADLINCHEAWGNSLPKFTQELWDSFLEIQAQRNKAIKKTRAQS